MDRSAGVRVHDGVSELGQLQESYQQYLSQSATVEGQ
jgi:hypothetical protein